MENLKDIDQSLSETIRKSDLKDVSVDFAENFMDSMLKDGILKDLPIIGAVLGVSKLAISLRDKLFLKKVIYFLSGIKHISIQQRQEMIDEINTSENQKMKVGEKLVYILDKCEDHIVAKYIAQFFSAFLEQKITYQDFIKGSRVIQNIFISDLEFFIQAHISEFQVIGSPEEFPHEDQFPYINSGICGFGYEKSYAKNDRYGEPEITGGNAQVWLTEIGKKLKENLILES